VGIAIQLELGSEMAQRQNKNRALTVEESLNFGNKMFCYVSYYYQNIAQSLPYISLTG
jgi:hypothetical protein